MTSRGTTARAIRLADELWVRVGERAHSEGRDRSQIIRDALTDYVHSVELWEDNAGGLHLVAADIGYDLEDAATIGGFTADAAGWHDGDWDPADELTATPGWAVHIAAEHTSGVAVGDQTTHVATWTPSGLTLHRLWPGGAACRYLGLTTS